MLIAKKVRLLPTDEQESLFWQSAGTARWAYNYGLGRIQDTYDETGQWLMVGDVKKEITVMKYTEEYGWLQNVSANVPKQALRNLQKALKRKKDGVSEFPTFKKKHGSNISFYVNYESLTKTDKGFTGEKLGEVITSEPLPTLPEGEKYSEPTISFDGKFWYLSVGYKRDFVKESGLEGILSIDLGLKDLATVAKDRQDFAVFENINKSRRVRILEKRLRRLQRKHSKAQKGSKNKEKLRRQIKKIYRTLTNIRDNHNHQMTSFLVKTKPEMIVTETLQIEKMMKNKQLAKSISDVKWYDILRQLRYKCEKYGITLIQVNPYYASSKTCSNCGHKKSHLGLEEREYICEECGYEAGRDQNATYNLYDEGLRIYNETLETSV
jgi:putative transposase